MMDIERIYAGTQFPMVVMMAALALLLAMRSYRAYVGRIEAPSPLIQGLLSLFLALWVVRLKWWHLRWMLRAVDNHEASERMADNVIVPLICNGVGLIIATVIVAIAGRDYFGRYSAPIAVVSIVALLASGLTISGAWL
jgi:hypothetical protein